MKATGAVRYGAMRGVQANEPTGRQTDYVSAGTGAGVKKATQPPPSRATETV